MEWLGKVSLAGATCPWGTTEEDSHAEICGGRVAGKRKSPGKWADVLEEGKEGQVARAVIDGECGLVEVGEVDSWTHRGHSWLVVKGSLKFCSNRTDKALDNLTWGVTWSDSCLRKTPPADTQESIVKDTWKWDELGSTAVRPEEVAASDHSDREGCRA